jgi:transposase-like protein
MDKQPETLLEAVVYFSDPDRAHNHFVSIRWPNGIACPRMGCGSADIRALGSRRRWRCKDCRRDFTAKVGTIFEDSPLPLTKWLPCVWLVTNAKNGISSCEVARALGVTQKTAWFMLHRVRTALKIAEEKPLDGVVEADETYIGGRLEFKHKKIREVKGPYYNDKTPVLGVVQRHGEARAWVVPNVGKPTIWSKLEANIRPEAVLNTDSAPLYANIDEYFARHDVVNHSIEEYVRGSAYTNTVENFWNLLKRTIKGTYVCPRPFHLEAYLDEQLFRYNARKTNDGHRFQMAAKLVDGKRITYKQLIARNPIRALRPKQV